MEEGFANFFVKEPNFFRLDRALPASPLRHCHPLCRTGRTAARAKSSTSRIAPPAHGPLRAEKSTFPRRRTPPQSTKPAALPGSKNQAELEKGRQQDQPEHERHTSGQPHRPINTTCDAAPAAYHKTSPRARAQQARLCSPSSEPAACIGIPACRVHPPNSRPKQAAARLHAVVVFQAGRPRPPQSARLPPAAAARHAGPARARPACRARSSSSTCSSSKLCTSTTPEIDSFSLALQNDTVRHFPACVPPAAICTPLPDCKKVSRSLQYMRGAGYVMFGLQFLIQRSRIRLERVLRDIRALPPSSCAVRTRSRSRRLIFT